MDLRSGRRPGSLPTPGPRRPPAFSDGGSSDRISALPDEMLLQILVRLRCARAAAHTSGLSRRWRGLWRHLPELSFRDISADAVDAALAQVACPALSLLEVDIPARHRVMDPARVSELLRAAARLAPADLVFGLWGHLKDWDIPIEIPCFERAISVKLRAVNLFLTPPTGGAEFPLLERLSVGGFRVDTAELVLRCPRLRLFEVTRSSIKGSVKIHSPTIEQLALKGNPWLSNIDIVTPVLKKFTLSDMTAGVTVLSFSAPMVENLRWRCWWNRPTVGFGDKWLLRGLDLWKKDNVCILHMTISAYFPNGTPPAYRSFSQEIAQLPAFSVLVLQLETQKHAFGALVSHLLGICSTIKSLTVDIGKILPGQKTCEPNCGCVQPQNWRDEVISLTALEEVEVTGFGGTDHEVDILKLVFRCATLMKRMTVVWAPGFSPTFGDCIEIYSIFQANPNVKCSVYRGISSI